MSFLKERSGNASGGWKAPASNHYNQWGKKSGMFSSIEVDKHVILPGVTFREEQTLKKVVDYVEEKVGECTLPQHLINDVYSMYVNDDFKRKETNGTNVIKQKVIDRAYNSLTKDVTKGSPLFSNIVTRELAVYLQKVQEQLEEELGPDGMDESVGDQDSDCSGAESDKEGKGDDDGQGDDGQGDDQGQGQSQSHSGNERKESDEEGKQGEDSAGPAAGEGTNQDGSGDLNPDTQSKMDKVDDILDKNEDSLDKAMQKAAKTMQDLEEQLGKDVLKDLAGSEPDFMDKMDGIKSILKRISINKESIKNVLAKILNRSENYFSKNFHTVEESLFDCEECEDLFGLEFLNPIFRNAEIMNIGNSKKVYTGKIDLYLDCSGSMGSSENFEGTSIRMIDLVKGIAMVLFRLNMIDKLYFFDRSLYEIKNINEFTILAFNRSGGTDFDIVVDQCKANGRNSVVITDGQDNVDSYAKNVFFCGIGGTRFGGEGGYSYGGDGFKPYRDAGQCVTYYNSKFNKCI